MEKIKIYFSHPVITYNTILEKWYINKIFKYYIDLGEIEVINPGENKHVLYLQNNNIEYFKNLVQSCNRVYVLPFSDNSIDDKIYNEIVFALEKNIEVFITKINFDFEKVWRLNTLDQQVKILKK